jgi:PAS domain S-box-containing protein
MVLGTDQVPTLHAEDLNEFRRAIEQARGKPDAQAVEIVLATIVRISQAARGLVLLRPPASNGKRAGSMRPVEISVGRVTPEDRARVASGFDHPGLIRVPLGAHALGQDEHGQLALFFSPNKRGIAPFARAVAEFGALMIEQELDRTAARRRREVEAIQEGDDTASLVAELQRLREAVAQASNSVVITNPDGIVQYVNPGFERISGYSASEILGKTLSVLRSGRHDRAFYQAVWETLQAGRAWHGDFVNRGRDGELYEIEAAISPIRDADGSISGYVEVGRNVTHERELEAQLRQSQKMEAVGRLAGGIAHDFNNILTVIQGYASLLLETADVTTHSDLEQLQSAAHRAAALTRQLLAFSRRQVMNPTVLDTGGVVRGIEPMLRRLISEDIRLVIQVGDDPVPALVDEHQLEQVLVNLVVNSRDALPLGGTISVRVHPFDVDDAYIADHVGARPGRYAAIEVVDDGIGMDQATLSRVFEPFFTTKGVGQGTGLGMAMVYGIVKQSNGYVWVESSPGAGTEVVVHLPWADRPSNVRLEEVASTPSMPDAGLAATATILVAEDSSVLRHLTGRMLRRAGYEVLVAPDGMAALAQAASHPDRIDLLLADVVMPGMSGPELALAFAERHPDTAVAFISGYADPGASAHVARIVSETPILAKPFREVDLLAFVEAALGHRRPISAE